MWIRLADRLPPPTNETTITRILHSWGLVGLSPTPIRPGIWRMISWIYLCDLRVRPCSNSAAPADHSGNPGPSLHLRIGPLINAGARERIGTVPARAGRTGRGWLRPAAIGDRPLHARAELAQGDVALLSGGAFPARTGRTRSAPCPSGRAGDRPCSHGPDSNSASSRALRSRACLSVVSPESGAGGVVGAGAALGPVRPGVRRSRRVPRRAAPAAPWRAPRRWRVRACSGTGW